MFVRLEGYTQYVLVRNTGSKQLFLVFGIVITEHCLTKQPVITHNSKLWTVILLCCRDNGKSKVCFSSSIDSHVCIVSPRPPHLRLDRRQGEWVLTGLRGPDVSHGGTMPPPPGPVEVPWGVLDFGSPLPPVSPLSLSGRGFSWAAWHSVWPGNEPEQPACLPLPASLPWDQRQSWDTARHSTLSVYPSIIPLLLSLDCLSFSSQSLVVILSLCVYPLHLILHHTIPFLTFSVILSFFSSTTHIPVWCLSFFSLSGLSYYLSLSALLLIKLYVK